MLIFEYLKLFKLFVMLLIKTVKLNVLDQQIKLNILDQHIKLNVLDQHIKLNVLDQHIIFSLYIYIAIWNQLFVTWYVLIIINKYIFT